MLVSFILARLLKRITFGLELDEIADLLSEVEDLAIEQAGLQPVATLLATGLATEEVFTAVAEEAGPPVAAGAAQAYRYEPDRSVVRVAACGPVGGELTAGDQMQTGGRERVRDDGAGGADAAKDSGLNHHVITAFPHVILLGVLSHSSTSRSWRDDFHVMPSTGSLSKVRW